jgi:hypothetical protein
LSAKDRQPWKVGDPIGSGEIYLPDRKTQKAYGDACRAALIESAAQHVLSLRTLQDRRAFIEKHPNAEAIKVRVKELWERKHHE